MSEIVCCGESRTGNFCSVCGRNIAPASTLVELLRHCRNSAKGIRDRTSKRCKGLRESGDANRVRWADEKEKQGDKNAEKWEAWAKEIAALMDKKTN